MSDNLLLTLGYEARPVTSGCQLLDLFQALKCVLDKTDRGYLVECFKRGTLETIVAVADECHVMVNSPAFCSFPFVLPVIYETETGIWHVAPELMSNYPALFELIADEFDITED